MAQFPSFSYGNEKTFGDMVRESGQFNWINVTLYPTSAGSWTDLDPQSQLKIERLSLLTDESLKDETVGDWCKEMGTLAQICEGSSCICLHMIGIKGHGLTQLESLLNTSKRIIAFKLTEFSFRGEFSFSEQLTENNVFGEFLEIQSCSLQSVVIGTFRLSSMHMGHIGKVLQSPGSMLQELLFCETKIEETGVQLLGVQLLAESMQSPENMLRELWLQWSEIGDEGARLISEALESPHSRLEDLDLQHNNIGDEGAKWLAKALQSPNTRLRKLILDSNRIGDAGAKLLGESLCSQCTRLEELSLPDNKIGDEGAKYIAQGAHGGVLKELNLSTNKGINESGSIAIAKCLQQRHNSLQRLYLTRCNNGENGIKHFAQMLQDPCCQLTFLSINTPTENDVIAIAESLHASKIQNLSLHSAQANDYLRGDSAAKKLLSALDSFYWCPLRFLRIEGSSSPQVARTIGSLISRNKAIDEGDLLRFDRLQPSTAKLFVCGDRTESKKKIINSILQQSLLGKKKSQSLMDLSLTSFECGENIKKLLVSDVQQSDGYFPFFSARPRQSLFLIVCRILKKARQTEIDMQLGYWLKSIYSSSSYHGPNAKVILCLDFSKEYYSSLGKGKNRDGIIRETRMRTQGIIKKFEHVIDFGLSDHGIDNIFATVQGERSDLKKMKHRIKTLFMELQSEVSRIPKICVDLLQFLPQLWKNDCPPFPIITFDQLVSKFEASHPDLQPSRSNVQTPLQLLDSRGYVVYNPTAGIILLALEFFAYLAHYLESLESASMVQEQEDIAIELSKKMHAEVDLVYKVVHCLHFAGIIRPKDERWDGDTDKIPKKFLLPSAVSELPRWREDVSNKQFFWGRRLECADKETMAIPQQLFGKLQFKQSICTMGSEWIHLIENSIQVIVRIGKEDEGFVGGKQWVDVMFRVPEERKHDLNQHVILALIINQIHKICYGDSVCPTVELQEKVIRSDAVKSLQLRDVQTEFLWLIMAELSEYGVEHSHVWKTGSELQNLKICFLESRLMFTG